MKSRRNKTFEAHYEHYVSDYFTRAHANTHSQCMWWCKLLCNLQRAQREKLFFLFKKCNCKYLSLCRFLCVFLLNLKHMCMLNAHFILTKASMLQTFFLRVTMSYSEVNVMMNKLKRFKPSQLNTKNIEFAENKEEFLLNRNLVHFWTI